MPVHYTMLGNAEIAAAMPPRSVRTERRHELPEQRITYYVSHMNISSLNPNRQTV